jgi:hypothetical protein
LLRVLICLLAGNFHYQDTWRFDKKEKSWAHVSGPRTLDGPPVWGTKGASSAAALPPSEHAGFVFREPLDGALWFLGGENGSEVNGMRGDLWAYNLSARQWGWRSGAAQFNGSAHYGTQGKCEAGNVPAARYAGQGWVARGRLWLFGGYGLDANGDAGYLSDTWAYRL